MAQILSKQSTYGGPYAKYVVEASTSSRTPLSTKVTVKVTANLTATSSLLGTGNGFGLVAGIYVGGSWHTWTLKGEKTSWSGTTKHSKSTDFRVSGLSAATSSLTGVKFRCLRTSGAGNSAQLNETKCSSISVTKVSSKYADVAIKAGTATQKQVAVTLSGLPKAVGFATTIKWYRGSTHMASTSVSSTTTTTSYAYTFTGLRPNTSYALKANVYYSDDTLLVSKSVTVGTPQETGTLILTPYATYIKATISGMFDQPNYSRKLEFYIKKASDSAYTLVTTTDDKTYYGEKQGTMAYVNLNKLISNVEYDVQVLIKNGTTILKTLTARTTTVEDTSLIPTAMIEQITQQLGTRLCTLEWVTSKTVGGTTYVVEAKSESGTEWEEFASMSEVISPVTVELTPDDMGNANVNFRIRSTNASVAEGTTNYSEVFTFYVRDDFLWDLEKKAGQPLIITANEWNRLREYAVARNEDLGIVVDIPTVSPDDEILASTYNIMKNAISNVTAIDILDKKRGDVITATDIDALRVAINTVA